MSPRPRRRGRRLADERAPGDERLDEVAGLRAAIAAAWEDELYPGDEWIDGCGCGRDECVSVARYFTGRTWRDVSFRPMKKDCGSAWDTPMHFLSPAAFRFFLPAFLLMFLDEGQRALDVLGDAIVRSLCPHEGWRDRVRGLTVPQQKAVLRFLRHVLRGRAHGRREMDEGVRFWASRVEAAPIKE